MEKTERPKGNIGSDAVDLDEFSASARTVHFCLSATCIGTSGFAFLLSSCVLYIYSLTSVRS